MKESEKNPTELINPEVTTNLSVSILLLVQGKPWISFAPQSQEQEVAMVPPSSHGKGHMEHLCSVCYLFKLEVCLIHFSIPVKSKFDDSKLSWK